MPDIYATIAAFQGQVAAREQATASRIVSYYANVFQRIEHSRQLLEASIVDAQNQGVVISPSWFFQQDRLDELKRQAAMEVARFAQYADEVTKQGMAGMIQDAQDHASGLFRQMGVAGTWADLNEGAIQALLGAASRGSPLQTLFAGLAPGMDDAITQRIVTGLALGQNPVTVARGLRDVLNVPLHRATTIARTEQLRAYREASRASYRRNRDLVNGWTWISAKDKTTCPACWAMHGSHHPLDEPMAAHPSCRCTMIPDVEGATLVIPPGSQDFDHLSPADQRAILGPGRYEEYRSGRQRLEDFAHIHHDPLWGDSVQVANKQEAAQNAARRAAQPPPPPPKAIKPPASPRPAQTPTAAPTGIPAGTIPVTDRITAPKGSQWEEVQRALRAINKVHGDGDLAPIKFSAARAGADYYGMFRASSTTAYHEATNRVVTKRLYKLELNQKMKTHGELTAAHEVGHALDYLVINQPNRFASRELSGAMGKVIEAATNSQAVQTIESWIANPPTDDHRLMKSYLRYLDKPEEIWARAYAQYIAEKSGDPVMLAQVAQERERQKRKLVIGGQTIEYEETGPIVPKHWTSEDFAPIRAAIDDLFRLKGWII